MYIVNVKSCKNMKTIHKNSNRIFVFLTIIYYTMKLLFRAVVVFLFFVNSLYLDVSQQNNIIITWEASDILHNDYVNTLQKALKQ